MILDVPTLSEMADLKATIEGLMVEIKNKEVRREWVKSRDAKKLLQCSTGTLQNLRTSGKLPFTRFGGTVYYNVDDIYNLLEKNKTVCK